MTSAANYSINAQELADLGIYRDLELDADKVRC